MILFLIYPPPLVSIWVIGGTVASTNISRTWRSKIDLRLWLKNRSEEIIWFCTKVEHNIVRKLTKFDFEKIFWYKDYFELLSKNEFLSFLFLYNGSDNFFSDCKGQFLASLVSYFLRKFLFHSRIDTGCPSQGIHVLLEKLGKIQGIW